MFYNEKLVVKKVPEFYAECPAGFLQFKVVVQFGVPKVGAFRSHIILAVLQGVGNGNILGKLAGNNKFGTCTALAWPEEVELLNKIATCTNCQCIVRIKRFFDLVTGVEAAK